MSVAGNLRHRALWRHNTGENSRGDRTYAEAKEIPCRIERRSRFEGGEGELPYTRIMVGGNTLVDVGDQLSLDGGVEWTNVDDFSDGVDMSGVVAHRIVYFEGGRL